MSAILMMNMTTISSFLPIGVLVTGLLGSVHCMGMCGPLVLASTKTVWERWVYNSGRLLGYLLLGAIMGAFGKLLFKSVYVHLQLLAAVCVGGLLVLYGIQGFFKPIRWQGVPAFFSHYLMRLFGYIHQRFACLSFLKSLLFGFSSAFLPCGLLYSVVLASVLTESAVKGALLLFFFWIGTVPALIVAPTLLSVVLKRFAWLSPKVVSGVFIVLGVVVFYTKLHHFGVPILHACCTH